MEGDLCVMSLKLLTEYKDKLYELMKEYESNPSTIKVVDFLSITKVLYELITEEQIKIALKPK